MRNFENHKHKTVIEWATDYIKKYGHPPLIIGQEYTHRIYDHPVELTSATDVGAGYTCTIRTRTGEFDECESNDLLWRDSSFHFK